MSNFHHLTSWVIATVAAALTMMGYVHSNFVTNREKISIESRLDRIENKVDQLLNRQ